MGVPQSGDALLYDAAIHASVHDGARASRFLYGIIAVYTEFKGIP